MADMFIVFLFRLRWLYAHLPRRVLQHAIYTTLTMNFISSYTTESP